MSHNNWDIDDLLNFDYGKAVPDRANGNTPSARGVNPSEKAAYVELRNNSARASQHHQAAEAHAAAVRAEREKRAAEVARQRAEQHAAEIARRRAEEKARQESQKAQADRAARDEYARLRAEAQAKEQARQEQLRRRAEEQARQEYLRRQAEEKARQEQLRRQAEEQARQEYMRRQAEEKARQEQLRRQAEEQARQEYLRRRAEEEARQEQLRRQAEEKARQEQLRRQAEEQARQEQLRRQAEEQARQEYLRRRAEEEARQEHMRRQAEEQARQEYMRRQAEMQSHHVAAEETDELVSGLTGEPRTAPVELPDEESRVEVTARKAQRKAREKARKASERAARKAGKAAAAAGAGGGAVRGAAGKVTGFAKFTKILSIAYIAAAAVFAAILLYMDVLPSTYMIAMGVILVLLSLIIVRQLTKKRIKTWARALGTLMACLLIVVYGMGSVYAMGTLSFLGSTSVKNENRVGSITKEPFNVVMTGIDVRGKIDAEGRSDVNMVVTINPETETMLLTSIPRDYEIRMPDKNYATDKLTHTGFYGVDTTLQAEADLLDIETNYYVKVNFTTVRAFINLIGGIDVYSEYEFTPVKAPEWTCKKGWNHMNGKQALAFARERKSFLTGDNQRVKNQQLVFEAMLKKATTSKTMVLKYNKVVSYLKDYFEMSFSSREIRSLLKMQLAKGPKWKIYKNTLEGPGATKTTYTGGSQPLYVTEQSPESIAHAQELIKAVLDGKKLKKDDDGNTVVADSDSSDSSESTEN